MKVKTDTLEAAIRLSRAFSRCGVSVKDATEGLLRFGRAVIIPEIHLKQKKPRTRATEPTKPKDRTISTLLARDQYLLGQDDAAKPKKPKYRFDEFK